MSQKTVIHESIDGYEIVKGFGEATPDAIATWATIQAKVLALDELAQLNSLKAKITTQATLAQNAQVLAQAAKKAGNAASYNTYNAQYLAAVAAIATLNDQLPALVTAYETARRNLFDENTVYCLPDPKSEQAISDTDYTTMKANFDVLTASQKLLLSGGTVADYRGTTYWTKTSGVWVSATIEALGVSIPDGSVAASALTDTQKAEIATQAETARVAALTDAQKLEEATNAQAAAKTSAAQTYQEALSTGTDAATALAASQATYKAALTKINATYGTSLT
jgi:hypothetical protein